MNASGDVAAARPKTCRFGVGALVNGVPRSVWLLTVVHLFLLLVWSVAVPLYRAPDEPNHVDLVRAVAGPEGWPAPDERTVSTQVHASMVAAGYSSPDHPQDRLLLPLQIEDAPPRDGRQPFNELAPDEPSLEDNQLAQHPPLHYVTVAAPVTLVTALTWAEWPHDQTVWLMRAVSVLLIAPLPLLAFAATRRLTGRGDAIAVGAAVVPLAVPQLTHIGSSVNNDNLLVLLTSLLTVALAYVATGDTSRRTAVGVGLIGGAALLTKGFALFLPAWVAGAYVVAAARGWAWRPALPAGAVALAVAGVTGGWWWVRNLLLYGALQPSVIEPVAVPTRTDPMKFWDFFRDKMMQRYWGGFGWDETHLAGWLVVGATVVVVAGVVLAFARRPAGAPWWRADLLMMLLPVVCVGAIVGYAAWDWYTVTGEFAGLQGRYLFPGIVGTAVVVAVGYGTVAGRFTRVLPLALLVGATVLQAFAAHTAIVYFWGPGVSSDLRIALVALTVWAPWPPLVLAGIAGGLAVAGAACLATLAGAARRPPSSGAEGTPEAPPPAPAQLPVESRT